MAATNDDLSDIGGTLVTKSNDDLSDIGGKLVTLPSSSSNPLLNGLNSVGKAVYNQAAGEANALNNLGRSVYQQGVTKPIDYLFNTNLTQQDKAQQAASNQAYNQQYGNSTAAKIGGIAGSIAPFMGVPEAMGLDLLSIPNSIAFNAGADQITGNNPITGGIVGFLSGAGGRLFNAGVDALRPSNFLAGGTTPEQLAQNLAVTRGTNTPLGNVVNSPALQRLNDNILTKIPGSGASKRLQQTGNQIVDQGNDLMSQLLGDNTAGDVGQTLQTTLKNKLNTLQQMKRDNFALPNTIADQIGLKIAPNNLSQTAQNALDEINQSPALARTVDSKIIDDLNFYANNAEGDTLKNSNLLKSDLSAKANNFFTSSQPYQYGIYKNLKDGLQQDIDSGMVNSGSDMLQNAHNSAMQFYRDNIAPFEDPNIVKFTKQGGDPDTLLSTFIKTGGINDRGNLINTLVNKLPQEQQTLPAYGYFSKSLDDQGNVNPSAFASQWNKLGTKQQSALVPDTNLRQQLNNYSQLVGMNKEALNVMSNSPTGQRLLDILTGGGATYGAIKGAGAFAKTAGIAGGIMGGANLLNRALTNENLRNNLVQKILEGGNNAPIVGNKILGGIAGIPAIYNNQ